MKNLTPTTKDCDLVFRNLVNEKKKPYKGRLGRVRPVARRRFHAYQENVFTLENLAQQTFIPLLKDALIHSYEVPTKSLKDLISDLKLKQNPEVRSVCQYCTINEPKTTDHYLEKGNYPEFSSFGLNLVPCCWPCNHGKEEVVIGGLRQYVNFYYDYLPTNSFLFCDVVVGTDLVPLINYRLDNSSRLISPQLFGIISRHFDNLSLLQRFTDFSNEHVTSIGLTMSRATIKTFTSLKALLDEEVTKSTIQYGVNHRKTALLAGMSNSTTYINSFL